MRETIREMRKWCNEHKKKPGAVWWRKTKAEFLAGETDAQEAALTLVGEEPPAGPWFQAFKGLLGHKPNRSALRALAQSATKMTKTETIILMKSFLMLNENSATEIYHVKLDMMRCINRLKLADLYADIIAVGYRSFDSMLAQVGPVRVCL